MYLTCFKFDRTFSYLFLYQLHKHSEPWCKLALKITVHCGKWFPERVAHQATWVQRTLKSDASIVIHCLYSFHDKLGECEVELATVFNNGRKQLLQTLKNNHILETLNMYQILVKLKINYILLTLKK